MNEKQLYRETLKLIKETNRRLEKLEKGVDINKGKYNPKTKRFERKDNYIVYKNGQRTIMKTVKRTKYPVGTWGTKKLLSNLENLHTNFITKNNRISTNINKASKIDLKGLNKALKSFLTYKTSQTKGIIEIENQTKKNIALELEDFDTEQLTNKDIETLYDLLGKKDFNDVTQYIPSSDLWIMLYNTKAKGLETYMQRIYSHIDENSLNYDSDLKESLIRIYNKFNS